ncbi:MAG: 4Fe-4S binding protein [Proteobacteria bacterium]|nr:4Fe-4S binding protein [Pseudomonadota bacterium]MBU1452237.1 4Fe-4S binding protein [Pseudomonadota bacterium]MBU2470598.1 4Fe-4S binding protein [Pseudomonadota bacterium]MBU2518536.1 4Fe-4S binding protein [Pseudomonadota bacterium]
MEGQRLTMMGNQAITQGALEAGVRVAAGYPGTPSSEIIQNLAGAADEHGLYVEWSINEKVSLEVAAAASLAGLRSLCAMKQNGVNVASDFLLHLAGSGVRAGMVLVHCDDPGALSSVNEGESRHFARMLELPLLEPSDFQEAKDMTKWAFELSEEIGNLVMLRSVTRLSHASGGVVPGPIPAPGGQARFDHHGSPRDLRHGPVSSAPVGYKHRLQQEKLKRAVELFEDSPFNSYVGPESPELLVITSSICNLYVKEALALLDARDRVGVLKLGTTWPLPPKLLQRHLQRCEQVLVVEEVIPFLEENVKIAAAEMAGEIGAKKFFGKREGTLPAQGELNPDLVLKALAGILDLPYQARPAQYDRLAQELAPQATQDRELAFCPGCPHRASFWSLKEALALDDRDGFICGDIGCYSLAMRPSGYGLLKTLHAMGSGAGMASGFGQLGRFGMDQPVMAVSGDSTFYHAVIPALINAVHQKSPMSLVVLDNSGTAMTGFQPHPGTEANALGQPVPPVDIEAICRSLGAEVTVCDPFDLKATQAAAVGLLADQSTAKVLILRQLCALSPQRKGTKPYEVRVDPEKCLGDQCGCNRLCTRVFGCPGLAWEKESGKARIDEVICAGCGVCASVCPQGAIIISEGA